MNADVVEKRIVDAQAQVDETHARLVRDSQSLTQSFRRNRSAWIVGGGLASGFALSFLPPKMWAKIGALAGGGGAILARSMLTPMIAGALFARQQASSTDTPTPVPVTPTAGVRAP